MTTKVIYKNYSNYQIPDGEDLEGATFPILSTNLTADVFAASRRTSFEISGKGINVEDSKRTFSEVFSCILSLLCSVFYLDFLYDFICNLKFSVPEVPFSQVPSAERVEAKKQKDALILQVVERHYNGNVYRDFTSKSPTFQCGTKPTCDLTPERLRDTYEIIKKLEGQPELLNARDQQIIQLLKEFIFKHKDQLNIEV